MWQITQKLPNDHVTNAILQKLIKTKCVNDYIAYVRMKNKMIKMQHNNLYIFTKQRQN